MEKVQVDIRKLQLLNDRINQTIDALNQVRLTAQQAGIPMGLSHSPYTHSPYMMNTLGSPFATSTIGSPFTSPYAYGSPSTVGFQHSSWDPSMAVRFLYGAVDPLARQAEIARANEANRVWELTQGLGHSTFTGVPSAWPTAPFGAQPWGNVFGVTPNVIV